jgi:hypothetical protein
VASKGGYGVCGIYMKGVSYMDEFDFKTLDYEIEAKTTNDYDDEAFAAQADSYTYNRLRKIDLVRSKKVHCLYCPYHRVENGSRLQRSWKKTYNRKQWESSIKRMKVDYVGEPVLTKENEEVPEYSGPEYFGY